MAEVVNLIGTGYDQSVINNLTSEIKRLRKDAKEAIERVNSGGQPQFQDDSDRAWIAGVESDIEDLQERLNTEIQKKVKFEQGQVEGKAKTETERQEKEITDIVDKLEQLEQAKPEPVTPYAEAERLKLETDVRSKYGALRPQIEQYLRSESAKRGGLYSGGYLGSLGEAETKRQLGETEALANVSKYIDTVQQQKEQTGLQQFTTSQAGKRSALLTSLGAVGMKGAGREKYLSYLRDVASKPTDYVPQYTSSPLAAPQQQPQWYEYVLPAAGAALGTAAGTWAGGVGAGIGGAAGAKAGEWVAGLFKPKKSSYGYPTPVKPYPDIIQT